MLPTPSAPPPKFNLQANCSDCNSARDGWQYVANTAANIPAGFSVGEHAQLLQTTTGTRKHQRLQTLDYPVLTWTRYYDVAWTGWGLVVDEFADHPGTAGTQWVAPTTHTRFTAFADQCRYRKVGSRVELDVCGSYNYAGYTPDLTVFTLPSGYRPSEDIAHPAMARVSGSYLNCWLRIYTTGAAEWSLPSGSQMYSGDLFWSRAVIYA